MTSLRLRFFLVVWPLVVIAMIILGLDLGRWTRVELQRVSTEVKMSRDVDTTAHTLLAAVMAADRDSAAVSAALGHITASDTMLLGAVVLDARGRVLGSSIPGLEPGAVTLDSASGASWTRTLVENGSTGRMLIKMSTIPIDSGATGQRLLALVPAARGLGTLTTTANVSTEDSSRALSRRILMAILVGSLLSALATALIAQPLLGRVGELSRATLALRSGNLDARVTTKGHDELANLGRAFNEMAEGLQASEAQRRRMITDIAHELRTPLTNIIGSIETVKDGLREPDARFIAALQEESALLNRLVDDLRDLSLADAGELPLTLQTLVAGEEARRAVDAFPMGPGVPRVVLVLEDATVTVRADRERLGQVLRNLIQNARTYSGAESTVIVRVGARGERTVIAVQDEGVGIASEHLAHVWDRFYRVDGSRTKETGGMGLGLALVARLVEAPGGAVGVSSVVGEGSTFEVVLPRV